MAETSLARPSPRFDPCPSAAPRGSSGGHTQTIWPCLSAAARRGAFAASASSAPDGDFWDFDWLDAPSASPDAPLVVLLHGLEGSSGSHYSPRDDGDARDSRLARRGAALSRLRRRTQPACRGRITRATTRRSLAMLAAIRARIPAATRVYVVGVSVGGSALLNWLGRAGRDAARMVTAAAAVSTPLDLTAAGIAIDQGLNRHLHAQFPAPRSSRRPRHGAALSRAHRRGEASQRARSIGEFDDAVTAPLHGFAGTDDYWRARRRSRGCAASRCRRSCSTRGTIRSSRRRRCPARRRQRRCAAGATRRTADTRASSRAVSRQHRLAAAAPASTSSSDRDADATSDVVGARPYHADPHR